MDKRRYAFLFPPCKRFHVLESSLIVFPWNFYWLTNDEVRRCPIPSVEVPPDSSQVGTRLKGMFSAAGFRAGSCNCASTARMLDEAGLDFIQSQREGVVSLIQENAAALKVPAPAVLVRRVVQLAIALERRAMKKRVLNDQPSSPGPGDS